jgi:hypothetical protein
MLRTGYPDVSHLGHQEVKPYQRYIMSRYLFGAYRDVHGASDNDPIGELGFLTSLAESHFALCIDYDLGQDVMRKSTVTDQIESHAH